LNTRYRGITKSTCFRRSAAFALGLVLLFGVESRAQEREKSPRLKAKTAKQITAVPVDRQQSKPDRGSALSDYYQKWLDEEVACIITPEERNVFLALQSEKEQESFIEQFWARRNPEPRSVRNEFKERHYLLIAYANKHFESSVPGWKTDRGRILIRYGMPDRVTSYPNGAITPPDEPPDNTFPYEVWWYRHIDGIGNNVELEFVDVSMNGEYRLAMSPEEKDRLFNSTRFFASP
jgi:GWxTD domain-containing protein